MAKEFDFQRLVNAIIDGEGDDAVDLVQEALDADVPVSEIIEKGLVVGMSVVSEKYDQKEFFVPDLAAAADAMEEALDLLKPLLERSDAEQKGVLVIGVIKDCSQEIGKNIVSAMLSGAGYKVYDLGINVSPEKFIETVQAVGADILAISCPMLQTISYLKDTAALLDEKGLRGKVFYTIGGASTNAGTAAAVGADAWTKDGNECIAACDKFIASRA